jgi:WD40 repeat protein
MTLYRVSAFSVLSFGVFAVVVGLRGQSPAPPDALLAFKGHPDTVEAVTLSPDGKFLATGCFDHNVRLFDAATGKEIRTYSGEQGHKAQVLCVAFTAKGDRIASGGADNSLKVWDVPVSFPEKTFATSGAATSVDVAADGKTFAVAGADGLIKVFPKGEEKATVELKGHVGAVTGLGSSGQNWVSAGADKTIRIWDAAGKQLASYHLGTADLTAFAVGQSVFTTHSDGVLRQWQAQPQPTKSFPALKDAVTAFAASADGNTVLYATADKVVTLGSVGNNQVAGTFTGMKAAVVDVAMTANIDTVLAVGADGSVILWDRQGKVKGELTPKESGTVTAAAFHPSQPVLFAATADGSVKGWSLPIDPKQPKEKAVKYTIKAHTGKATGVLVLPNGQLVTTGADKLVRVWDVAKPEKPVKEIGPLAAPVSAPTASRDGQLLAGVVGKDVLLWNPADGKEAGKITQTADVLSMSFSADKSRLLIGRGDNQAALVEVKDGTVVQTVPHAGAVRGVMLHPNNQSLITASADKSVVISPVVVQRLITLGGKAAGLVLSPDNQRVVTVGPGKECVTWLTGNGQKDKSFPAGGEATAAAFSKDNQRLAVAGSDGSVKLYTVADAKLVGSFAAGGPVAELAFHPTAPQLIGTSKNTATVWTIAFQPNQPLPPEFGKSIQTFPHPKGAASPVFNADKEFYTAGEDKLVRRFRIASELPVKNLQHPNLVDSAAFDDTGDRLATGCHDGNLRIWDVPKNTPLKTIEAHVTKTPQTIQNPIYAVLWTKDHKQVFTASFDRSIKLWDAASGNMVREFKAAPEPKPADPKTPPKKAGEPVGHRDQVFSIALSKDGKLLASGSSDQTVKLWDVATGKVVRDFENPDLKPAFPDEPAPSHPGWVHAVRFTPDGQFLVSAGRAPKGKAYLAVWQVSTGKRVYGAERNSGPIHSMEVTQDGTKLILACAPAKGQPDADVVVIKLPGK